LTNRAVNFSAGRQVLLVGSWESCSAGRFASVEFFCHVMYQRRDGTAFQEGRMLRFLARISVFAVSLCICGCGNPNNEVVPASGLITYKGQPVEGADVMFSKEGAAAFSSGRTDSKGEFKLSTFGTDDGAIVGVNLVSVSKTAQINSSEGVASNLPKDPDSVKQYGGQGFAKFSDPKWLASQKAQQKQKSAAGSGPTAIPQKYSTPDKSAIKFSVGKGLPNHFKIELKD
jgi:hypothetical protein